MSKKVIPHLYLANLLPLLIFLGLCVALAIGLSRDPRILPSQLINKPFPAFELPGLYDESELIDESLLEGEVSLVNIFGSWCVACLQEHPLLMELTETEAVRVIGVNWRDERERGLAWLERHGDPYDRIIFDAHSELVIDLGITGAPESFVVDKAGQIRYKHVGPITPKIWRTQLEPLIRDLRAAP